MYKLRFSRLYQSDLDECYNYIDNKLQNPMAANRLIIEAKKKLIEVRNNPTHRPLVNDEYLANLGYRLKTVKNFILFYIIDNDNKRIKIVRFLYGKRDWINILKETPLDEIM